MKIILPLAILLVLAGSFEMQKKEDKIATHLVYQNISENLPAEGNAIPTPTLVNNRGAINQNKEEDLTISLHKTTFKPSDNIPVTLSVNDKNNTCSTSTTTELVSKTPIVPLENDSRTLSWIHLGKPWASYKETYGAGIDSHYDTAGFRLLSSIPEPGYLARINNIPQTGQYTLSQGTDPLDVSKKTFYHKVTSEWNQWDPQVYHSCLVSLNSLAQNKVIKLGSRQAGWQVFIDRQTGFIVSYQSFRDGKWDEIDFRKDQFAGPTWKDVPLSLKNENTILFEGNKDNITYSLQYLVREDHLVVRAGMKNQSDNPATPSHARLIIGINSEMKSYPDWDNQFFPTLLRCEKTHFWGYFMSPLKRIFVIGVSDPVASYTINYILEGSLEWNWGHQIFTASLDLLHQGPLPARHPQDLASLGPGEYKKWDIHLGDVDSLAKVKSVLARWLRAPMIEADRYTVKKGENARLTINSSSKIAALVISPSGGISNLLVNKKATNVYSADLKTGAWDSLGLYTIKVTDLASAKTSEAMIYLREPFSWYMKEARDNAFAKKPIISGSAESSYGFYAGFLARKYFPDKVKDQFLEDLFNDKIGMAFDLDKGQPLPDVSPSRVENISTTIGLYTDLWEATKDTVYLINASKFGDYITSAAVQKDDGSYRSGETDYTAVIYPAKSMLDLAAAEKELAKTNNLWQQRYLRHTGSAEKAIKHLLDRLDNIETEGDLTFEDGMISCSALQLGLEALQKPGKNDREIYTHAAAYMMDKHTCLEQNLIPDARMRGATLRYWEELDIYFVPNQGMCSPHGWTAWKIYADYYLYLLTGNEKYLVDFMDTLGACLQIMDRNGELRWGFIPDPYIKAQMFVQKTPGSIKGITKDTVVGEQYLPMISGWFRPADENKIVSFEEQGGAGDNTVYEIFKALEECALNKAYLILEKDGTLKTWNCSASKENGIIKVIPSEKVIENVHLNMAKPCRVQIQFEGKNVNVNSRTGLQWISINGFNEL